MPAIDQIVGSGLKRMMCLRLLRIIELKIKFLDQEQDLGTRVYHAKGVWVRMRVARYIERHGVFFDFKKSGARRDQPAANELGFKECGCEWELDSYSFVVESGSVRSHGKSDPG